MANARPRARIDRQIAVLRTLQTVCANLRGLQTSAATISVYRDVEDILEREIARLSSAGGGGAVTRRAARRKVK